MDDDADGFIGRQAFQVFMELRPSLQQFCLFGDCRADLELAFILCRFEGACVFRLCRSRERE
nr:hypothetical protein [Planococcus glaciei]